MACSNSASGDENNGAYQPYNDSITPQNSADGSYDSTFYIRNKVRDDIGSGKKSEALEAEDEADAQEREDPLQGYCGGRGAGRCESDPAIR